MTAETRSTLPGTARSPVQPNDAGGNRLVGFSWRFWILVGLTGVGAGLGGGLLMMLLRAVQHVSYSYQVGDFLDGVRQAPTLRRVLVVLAAGFVTSAGIYVLNHGRGGSGGKLNERIWFHSGRLAEAKTIAQSVLSIAIVGMGASLGRETAPKQTGAAIASWLSRWAGLSPPEARLLAACGAGAGMGAVYNVPLGGAMFALEVLLGTLALPLIPPALAASVIATAVSWLMLPNEFTYAFGSHPIALTQLAWAVAFGPVAGVASVLYVRLIVLADHRRPQRNALSLWPILAFAALALLSIRYPELLGNGKDVTQLALAGTLGLPLLAALVILKPLATAGCLGSGAPGGLFTPSMTFGALLGGLLGHAWSLAWPGAAPGSYAMIGAAAVLAASMQAPVAALVLLFELSRHVVPLMVPILIAVTGATVTARRLDPRSVYSGRVHTGREAAESTPPPATFAYRELLLPHAETISVAATYPDVLERFAGSREPPKPIYVIDEEARLSGRLLAAQVMNPPPLTRVLSVAAAGDLMTAIEPLNPDLSKAEALARLAAEPAGQLPVVDAEGRLLGVAATPESADKSPSA